VDQLREQVQAEVITPGDAGYDQARVVQKGMFDKRSAGVVRPGQVTDVIAAVHFARGTGLELALRGGGHSGPGFGTSDRGLVIDLSLMRACTSTGRRERPGGGATWRHADYATHAYGLATTGAIVSATGIGGTASLAPHFRSHVSGRPAIRMDDGTEFTAWPGGITALPSGHDARVAGDEPAVTAGWYGAGNYAK
jgi:FAD binding domain